MEKNTNHRDLYLLLLLWLTITTKACTQPSDRLFADHIAFCDSNFPEEDIPKLRSEFNQLEQYFIQAGLLKDKSGSSYYAVYQQISQEGDLIFNRTQSFPLLESLNPRLMQRCFYKLLTEDQLLEINPRHLEAAEAITKDFEDSITPGVVAQRIIDNLSAEDFDLEYYRISSLLVFHNFTSVYIPPTPPEPDLSDKEVLFIEMNGDQITALGKPVSINQITKIIDDFTTESSDNKIIKIASTRDTRYDLYIRVLDMTKASIEKRRHALAKETFATNYSELSVQQRKEVDSAIPKNIIISLP